MNTTPGTINIGSSTISYNSASYAGGLLYNSGAIGTMSGLEMTGSTDAAGNADDMYGAAASIIVCTSGCSAGSYGACSVAIGADACKVNCACTGCPVGKYSIKSDSKTVADCTECPEPSYAKVGSTSCGDCIAGYFKPIRHGRRRMHNLPQRSRLRPWVFSSQPCTCRRVLAHFRQFNRHTRVPAFKPGPFLIKAREQWNCFFHGTLAFDPQHQQQQGHTENVPSWGRHN